MVEYNEFKKAILCQQKILLELKELRIEEIKIIDITNVISTVNTICFNLKSSASNSLIVGNSKTLAHILPNLLTPIDRQYIIRFFATEPPTFLD